MQVSTRGRYAIMALVDLCLIQKERGENTPVTLAEIASRQDISLSYLEQLFAKLRSANVVKSVRGPGGGYTLNQASTETWLSEVVSAVDERVDQTRCGAGEYGCRNGERCNAHHLWLALSNHIASFLNQTSIEMVLTGKGFPAEIETKQVANG
jgi:Rrf2 family iron-sulfur cluster assembly transcriptional regulator